MKNFKSHFKFNKQERSGIFFLLLIIVVLQLSYFILRSFSTEKSVGSFSLDKNMQAKIDALKEDARRKDPIKIYPFNPNFITDYKGYTLGMSLAEIDRLHSFRKNDEYINSSEDFQKVTLISDSLLKVISPYFKFPEWVDKNDKSFKKSTNNKYGNLSSSKALVGDFSKSEKLQMKDLNSATAEELKSIRGIGEKLSTRIIKFRDRLGGFLTEEQLYDVYYLEPEVAKRVLQKFKVFKKPSIEKTNINTASAAEMSALVYISFDVAEEIVFFREMNGPFSSLNELKNIEGFPINKIDRIALYLSL